MFNTKSSTNDLRLYCSDCKENSGEIYGRDGSSTTVRCAKCGVIWDGYSSKKENSVYKDLGGKNGRIK